MTLLEIEERPIKKIESWAITISKVEGGGAGVAENGDEILDYRATDKVVINVTFAYLTIEEYSELMKLLKQKTLTLKYWRGEYDTGVFKVGDVQCELLKSEQRPNTERSNRWTVTTTFTKIKMEA